MRYKIIQTSLLILFIGVMLLLVPNNKVSAGEAAQQPTGSIPTVTGTSLGPTIRVNLDNDQINVRNGPGTEYNKVGILISGQVVSALGKSAAGLWILISYSGVEGGTAWVYAPLVTVSDVDAISIVAPPPTPAPLASATIDPILAAQFILEVPATRLPTFTAPSPILLPAYVNEQEITILSSLPPAGLIITLFGVIGIIGTMVSITRRR